MNAAVESVRVSGVTKRFGEVEALAGIDLSLAENEFVSVVGTSGCGKSTLLSIIAGLEEPTTGTVESGGSEVLGPGRDRGVVFQQATLLPWLTAGKNVEFALRGEESSAKERKDRALGALDQVGLADFAGAYPSELSGGMQQRVALARSLSYGPSVLLMDEPFGALDALTRRSMQEWLTQVWERHRMTVLLITHDIEEAVYTSDRVVVMTPRPGRIRQEFRVDLPRPRSPHMIATPEFQALTQEILSLIHTPEEI